MAEKTKDGGGPAGELPYVSMKGDGEVIAELAQRFAPDIRTATPVAPGQQMTDFVIVPEGMRLESLQEILDETRAYPERRQGRAQLDEVASLVEYTRMFAGPDSRIYARAPAYAEGKGYTEGSVLAVIDHHQAGFDGQPDWCAHRAVLPLPLAPELTRWLDVAGKALPQADFAAFVDDNIDDVMPALDDDDRLRLPGLATLIGTLGVAVAGREDLRTVSRGLMVAVGRKVESRYNPSSGETVMTFAEEHAGDGVERLKVPNAFVVRLPVFEHGEWYPLLVRLKYRPSSGGVVWLFSFHNLAQAIADAFADVRKAVADGTELPVWIGSPA